VQWFYWTEDINKIHLQKESTEKDLQNLNYIKNTQTHIFKFEYFETVWKVKFYCVIVFYTFLGIQRHLICIFWIDRSKDMIFQSLHIFPSFILINRTYSNGAGHVALFQAGLAGTPSDGSLTRAVRFYAI
jgi:hypothetical protein